MNVEPKLALLSDRGAVRVTGADALKLLHGLITSDMAHLERQPAIYAALLQPQGKILFDFFVAKRGEGYLLDVARDKAADLVKRLSFYKLRADVVISDVSSTFELHVAWAEKQLCKGFTVETAPGDAVAYPDPRLPQLGWRVLAPVGLVRGSSPPSGGAGQASADDYHAHRIGLGVPEGGKDYPFGDTFPHEADMDALHGVDFEKGCFIGQEVVSRMQHRAVVRKRVVPVTAAGALPASGAEVQAGRVPIGRLGSVAGRRGLALIRLDRAAETLAKGGRLHAGDIEIELVQPVWAKFSVPRRGAGPG